MPENDLNRVPPGIANFTKLVELDISKNGNGILHRYMWNAPSNPTEDTPCTQATSIHPPSRGTQDSMADLRLLLFEWSVYSTLTRSPTPLGDSSGSPTHLGDPLEPLPL